jgi:aspartyl/asparaginyl-tRNA synthetase
VTSIGERVLIELYGAIWLTQTDRLSVHFNQVLAPDPRKTKALCEDLLAGPGGVFGLGQQYSSSDQVKEALTLHEVLKSSYYWYIGIRDVFCGGKALETAGWRLGMEIFLTWILKQDDIRDIPIIPRMKDMKFGP